MSEAITDRRTMRRFVAKFIMGGGCWEWTAAKAGGYVFPDGRRVCKTCRRASQRRFRSRNK